MTGTAEQHRRMRQKTIEGLEKRGYDYKIHKNGDIESLGPKRPYSSSSSGKYPRKRFWEFWK